MKGAFVKVLSVCAFSRILGARLELFEGGHHFFIQDPCAFERITAFMRDELDD